jgi:hypothetical protein
MPGIVGRLPLVPRRRVLAVGVGLDHAGIDREALATNQALGNAAGDGLLEQLAQQIALPEAAVAVLGERRMVWHRAVQAQSAKPPVRQIEMDLVAQPTLGADPQAIADDQHPDHQLRVDRGPPGLAIVRP